jgi:hypothetical protein
MSDVLRIDRVWHWGGPTALPDRFKGDGPWLLSLSEIEGLADSYDVMLRSEQETLSKREKRTQDARCWRVLALDHQGGKFRSR